MNILLTGPAGFIGFHLTKALCEENVDHNIIGIDNLNHYYDVTLKQARLKELSAYKNFHFSRMDIADHVSINHLYEKYSFDIVIHLAAQAGVRYSLTHPEVYNASNNVGFFNIIDGARQQNVSHFIFASSSSVYGANKKYPYAETDPVDHPISFYASTKKSNELTAHAYASLYGLACTGLRFFTVFGPWGRPDMAPFKFTKNIFEDKPIEVFNYGEMYRDFTYIDDIINGVMHVINCPFKPDLTNNLAPYRIYNIGRGNPIKLTRFIEILENKIGKKANKQLMPIQPGDVIKTWADTSRLQKDFGYAPRTEIEEGISRFVDWYAHYYI